LYRQVLDAEPDNVSARLDLAALYAELGQVTQAETEFRRVPESKRNEDVRAMEVARYYAARGQLDDAFHALERTTRRLSHELRDLEMLNSFDRLRHDPRFEKLTRTGGHPFAAPPSPWPGFSRPGAPVP
jgi:predicted Zn-dependent protease